MNQPVHEASGAEERVRRRHQEGVPRSHASTTRTATRDNGAEERFKEVQAPTTSSGPRETEGVRHLRRGRCSRVPGGAGAGGCARFEEFDLSNLGDLLGDVRRGAAARGESADSRNDLETHVRISFEDSLKGVQVRVPIEVETACTVCHGTGAEPGTRR